MAKKPCGVNVPMPTKDDRPNAAQDQGWMRNKLVGGNEQYRTIQDFGGPKGWPPAAPTSSVTKDETPVEAPMQSGSMIGRRRK